MPNQMTAPLDEHLRSSNNLRGSRCTAGTARASLAESRLSRYVRRRPDARSAAATALRGATRAGTLLSGGSLSTPIKCRWECRQGASTPMTGCIHGGGLAPGGMRCYTVDEEPSQRAAPRRSPISESHKE